MTEPYHSSPSDIDLFLNEPSLWLIKHFIGYRTEVGPAAHRGTAIEFGLAAHLVGDGFLTVDDEGQTYNTPENQNLTAKGYALMRYRQLTFGEITDAIESEAKNVPLMLDQAITAFAGRKQLIQRQRRIDMTIEGVPIQGYLDFVYPDELIDLKTTKAIPSAPRPGHVRQMAVYSAASHLPARLCYCSAKKAVWYSITPEASEVALRQVQAACRAMRKIRENPSWRDAAELFPPRDLTSYFFDDVSRHIATDLWSL